jgi:oligopeptide/dipeptide ABC transporter ATP-binding protein
MLLAVDVSILTKQVNKMSTILKAVNLSKAFQVRKSAKLFGKRLIVKAVDNVNFEIEKGETFGIVGESGCGKTTLARLVLRLTDPTGGKIYFEDRDISTLRGNAMKILRSRMQMVFQDPFGSLNPIKSIGYTVSEPLRVHKTVDGMKNIEERLKEALDTVGLPSTKDFTNKRPGELSGGERQRVGIARALVLRPDLIVADEPVSMLDASVRAEIISLMTGLKEKIGLTYLFITHEMAVAYNICERIAVMYAGRIVELGKAEDIMKSPQHPYTKLLMEAILPLHPDKEWGKSIKEGEVAYYVDVPQGCKFCKRCPCSQDICLMQAPDLEQRGLDHFVACYMKT